MGFPVYGTNEYLVRLGGLITAEYPPLTPAVIHLYKNNIAPDANQIPSDFEEADFDGYEAVPLVMSGPTMNDQGLIVTKSSLVDFQSDTPSTPQTVFGVYITNAAGTRVIAAQQFDVPQNMGGTFPQACTGVWRMSEPLTNIGWFDVEN